MKKLVYLIIIIITLLGLIVTGCCPVVPPAEQGVVDDKVTNDCITIQDGILENSNFEVITTGYDDWGYNYQSHMFNGFYWNNTRPGTPYTKETIDQAPSETLLIMKWSDTWLSNKDCDGDGLLDRGYACDPENPTSSACEGAWLTNHQRGEYVENGKTCKWSYFVKIVMVPEDAYKGYEGDVQYWYTADDIKIGSVIWTAYARIQQVENDLCAGIHGVQYLSPVSPGFGEY